jgi:hypothetical protein
MLAQDLTPLAAQPKELNKNLGDLTNDKNCEESTKSLTVNRLPQQFASSGQRRPS